MKNTASTSKHNKFLIVKISNQESELQYTHHHNHIGNLFIQSIRIHTKLYFFVKLDPKSIQFLNRVTYMQDLVREQFTRYFID